MTRLLTPAQVAEIVGVTRATIYKMRRQGRLPPSIKIGRHTRRWREESIHEFLAQREEAVSPAEEGVARCA